jgi:hypothetical protein
LKAVAVKPVQAVIVRQRHCKHFSAAADTNTTVEDVMFSARPLLGIDAINTEVLLMERIYAVEVGSGVMIYIPSFIKIGWAFDSC